MLKRNSLKPHLLILTLFFFLLIFPLYSAGYKRVSYELRIKILNHYADYAFYGEDRKLNLKKVRVISIRVSFFKKLYVLIDYNTTEHRTMLYGHFKDVLYPINDKSSFNKYVRKLSLEIKRSRVLYYFKIFLYLEQYYSRNTVYTKIDKEKLIKKYGNYGGDGFEKRMQNYFLDEPLIQGKSGKYHVNFPTFTIIGRNLYYRLRVTNALITKKGIIEKIWGKNSVYFIYNGEKAKITRKRRKYFEKNVY